MHGLAVHARQGHREQYQPLRSELCDSPEPRRVLEVLLRLYPFRTVYIADLDALMGRPAQTGLLQELRREFPHLRFWVDRGLPEGWTEGNPVWKSNPVTVLGSESLDQADLPRLGEIHAQYLLSLDFREGRLLGPEELLRNPAFWPEWVILMNLTRVGAPLGPDMAQALEFTKKYPKHRFFVAGGVRDPGDLARLKAGGMAGVLIASALHSGKVDGSVLRRLKQDA